MKQDNLKSSIRKFTPQKRRAVAEVISSLLLVVITVVGALILTTFLDETFVAGSLSVSAGTDSSLKTIRLLGYDTRDGSDLFEYSGLDNEDPSDPTDQVLCRASCSANPNESPIAPFNGTEFLVFQIENRGLNPIWLSDVDIDRVRHTFDPTIAAVFNPGALDSSGGDYPEDGTFSILPADGSFVQNQDNQILGGQAVNILVKLDSDNPDIELSKTMRVQLNIGTNTLQDFLIESGGAQ